VLTRPPNPAGQGRAGHRFESCHLSCGSSCGYRMMGITKQKFGNEYEMSIYELFHYSLFPGLFVAFTYNKKQPPAFGAAPAFWCILLSFLGLSFRHIPNNLSNYNVLTANAPFFYQISGTWSNHEGSILSWCRIPSFYGFLLCYRGRPQSHNVSKRGGHRETFFYSFVSNFVKNSILSLPRYEQKSGAAPQLYTPFVLRTLVDSELRSRRNRTFDGPALFYAPLSPERKISFAPLGARRSHGSREGKRTHPLHLARDDKERASSIDEQRIDGALGIALFFSPFLSASSDPFVRNFFVRTEPLAESNPVPQDPISAIHPPCIYAGDVASAMGFGLCRSKMMNGIVALHSPPMRKDAAEKNGTLLRSAGCVGSRITSELFTLQFKGVGAKCYPALLLRSNRSLLMLLRRRFFAFSSLWTGALVDTGREQAKRVVRNGKKDTTTSPLCWTAGANTVVSDQDQEPIRIWILTCRWFLTVGILPGSWWAHHELGRGGWWFRDPVENASFMPRVLATARIHSVILPLLHSWTSFLNIVTLPCCVSGTFSIRSGLLAPVHSFATDDTRGIFLWRLFLLMTGISMILFSQMKQQASVRRTYKKEMVVARSTLVHLRHSARAQPRPVMLWKNFTYCWAGYSEPAIGCRISPRN
jgi:cytochrome c assembly protein